MKKLMQGNEAIARGAWEAGVTVACAYPGTPSSEILSEMARYGEVYAEWSPNEKVALEVAAGAAYTGARALACMKHVGMNVASDAFMTISYTGVKGGLVIVIADDPGAYSSQNEQDSRNWARFAKVPMLEPADAQECKDYTKMAFEISERFETPVLIRGTTRICHGSSAVTVGNRTEIPASLVLDKGEIARHVMVPTFVRARRRMIEERMKNIEAYADTFSCNTVELNDRSMGIITSGAAYMHAKEVLPHFSYLKLGMVWPLPKEIISRFCRNVRKVAVVEELDPVLETEIRALGYEVCRGKNVFPAMFELSPRIIKDALSEPETPSVHRRVREDVQDLPVRPPSLCAGCSHRALFYALKEAGLFVFGDIGCYTLASGPPLKALHANLCMGAGVSLAYGAGKALGAEGLGKICAVLGDSTFLHGGVAAVMDTVYNKGYATTIILDNRTTGMTGLQEHPGTGFTARGDVTSSVDYEALVRALGVKHVRKVDPYNVAETLDVIKEEVNRDESSVIIMENGPCMLHRREKRQFPYARYAVDQDTCRGCKVCLGIGCPALSWVEGAGKTKEGRGRKGVAVIDGNRCPGCGLCAQVCTFQAICPEKG